MAMYVYACTRAFYWGSWFKIMQVCGNLLHRCFMKLNSEMFTAANF